jgi:hypothetical protein
VPHRRLHEATGNEMKNKIFCFRKTPDIFARTTEEGLIPYYKTGAELWCFI